METINSITFNDIFKDTEDYLHHLNPKNLAPPFISTSFSIMRKSAFQVLKECSMKDDNASKAEKVSLFINKFEYEYIETLRSKLREQYIDIILQKHYEVPNDINIKEAEGYGAISEIAQLAIAIAEWTLELEICAYTFEGLNTYGLIDETTTTTKDKKQENYLEQLKKEYDFKSKSSLVSSMEYLLRRAMNLTFSKFSSLALAKGMSMGGFGGKDILDIIISISTSGVVPWKAVLGTVHIPWAVGSFAFSHIIKMLSDYVVKRQVFTNMAHVQETFENNKLSLMTERRTVLDLVERIIGEKDSAKRKWDLGVLARTVRGILHPSEKGNLAELELSHKGFNVKEQEDCILVEEKEFLEKEDKSGVVVIDW